VLDELGAPESVVDEVARLVESTAGHMPGDDDLDGCVLADADLAILGAPQDEYARYARDVRAEYAHVNDEAWRAGRAAVLRSFLGRSQLFHAWQLRDAYEARARENLRTELASLTTS
jgi:predicted metal-dependent HD superfamily phosphohydrolase